MADKKENTQGQATPVGQKPNNIVTGSGLQKKKKSRRRLLLLAVLVLIIVVVAVIAPGYWKSYQQKQRDKKFETGTHELNAAFQQGDSAQALEHAKNLLQENPNNIDSILAVANLLDKENPEEAKKYYIRAFEEYKKIEDPEAPDKGALTYWAAAGFAEDAGYIDEAKAYYQRVVDEANMVDGYEIELAKQAKEALKRLQ